MIFRAPSALRFKVCGSHPIHIHKFNERKKSLYALSRFIWFSKLKNSNDKLGREGVCAYSSPKIAQVAQLWNVWKKKTPHKAVHGIRRLFNFV